jgi:hypothetical protein
MQFITFSYSNIIRLGRCSISSVSDTTITSFWNSTESQYQAFDSLGVQIGDKVFFNPQGSISDKAILIGYVTNLSATVVTISDNPGQIVYDNMLQEGYFQPFIMDEPYLYSYPVSKYCGASLENKGNTYRTYPSAQPFHSAATYTKEYGVLSLYFEKGDGVDEVKLNVQAGTAGLVIKDLNKLMKGNNDINISGSGKDILKNMVGVKSITSAFVRGDY